MHKARLYEKGAKQMLMQLIPEDQLLLEFHDTGDDLELMTTFLITNTNYNYLRSAVFYPVADPKFFFCFFCCWLGQFIIN